MSQDTSRLNGIDPRAIRLCRDHPVFCEVVEERREANAARVHWAASDAPEAAERVAEFDRLIAELDREIESMITELVAKVD